MQKREIGIGRSELNDFIIDDKSVSKFHAKLVFESDGSLWIQDMKTSNGTFVNGTKIDGKQKLGINDQVRLANIPFDWQNSLLVAEESAQEYKQTPIYTPKKKSKTVPYLIAGIAFCALLVFALTQNFWGVFESTGTGNPDWNKKKGKIEYSVECLRDSSVIGGAIGVLGDVKKEIIKGENVTVSISEEIKVGEEVKAQMDRQYKYSSDGAINNRIDNICKKLLNELKQKKFDYKWYVIDSKEINAFTAGGKIFITTGIINFARTDDELACVLGHEIYHNELGHITDKLKENKIANKIFGEEFGDIAAVASAMLSVSFNQENEAFCDMYGLDLAVNAGYNGCAAIDLWDRMSQQEQKEGDIMKIFRSHPFSAERSRCIHHHIDHNYEKTCRSN
jgi:pSer/pThr/pTyr-binding forkhead associated (FHA) protein